MPERSITPLILVVLLLGTLLALRSLDPPSSETLAPVSPVAALVPDMVPLVTGNEPISEIFTKAGCPVRCGTPGNRGQMDE